MKHLEKLTKILSLHKIQLSYDTLSSYELIEPLLIMLKSNCDQMTNEKNSFQNSLRNIVNETVEELNAKLGSELEMINDPELLKISNREQSIVKLKKVEKLNEEIVKKVKQMEEICLEFMIDAKSKDDIIQNVQTTTQLIALKFQALEDIVDWPEFRYKLFEETPISSIDIEELRQKIKEKT
ncbi:MAG: hypothetical protein MHPSP_001953 [Paramarteilia canceri]